MIKCALSLLIFATCIVGIFTDDFCEKQRKLDSECAKYCYQVAKPLLHMAPICHNKDAEIKELNAKIANLQNELVVYKQQEKKSLEEVKLNEDLYVKLADMQNKLFYEERERKSKEENNKYNEQNDKFNELNKKIAVYEYLEKKCLEEGTKCNEINTKLADLQNKLVVYEERERKSKEEGNMCNELNATLAELPRILLNLQEREKKGIDEMNKSKQFNEQLGEVQEKLADFEERENKSKEIYSKAESSLKASLDEHRVRLSKLESINLALSMSNQEVKEDLKQCNNYKRAYKNTCLKSWPGEDTTGSVEIEEMEAFEVSCVNDLNSGPGWMLIQNRIDKRSDNYFYENWPEYRNGFSIDDGSFFIGLEKLYRLTNAVPHELYIDMEEWNGKRKFAHYDYFRVGNESEQYPLKDLGNYTPDSNAGDALRDNNNMKFSTWDRDNDNSPDTHCAKNYYSGWWHNNCTKANLNGWQSGMNEYDKFGIWWDSHVQLKNVRMLIRPRVKK